jgi:hypothetical protein
MVKKQQASPAIDFWLASLIRVILVIRTTEKLLH